MSKYRQPLLATIDDPPAPSRSERSTIFCSVRVLGLGFICCACGLVSGGYDAWCLWGGELTDSSNYYAWCVLGELTDSSSSGWWGVLGELTDSSSYFAWCVLRELTDRSSYGAWCGLGN
jgi:hypothetical protein